MAEMTIRLVVDPVSGKRSVVIGYHSESDALPIEHEEEHRALVRKMGLADRELSREGNTNTVAEATPEAPQKEAQPNKS